MNSDDTICISDSESSSLACEIRKKVRYPLSDILFFDSVGSTNTVLKGLADAGTAEGTLVIANEQTSGKGRNGKSFFSPRGTGIYMSLLLRPSLSADKAKLITTCAAVAVCRAIENVCRCEAKIKWVNDVYVDDKKVCGILTEGAVDPLTENLSYAVLGIGINVYMPDKGFGPLEKIAGALLSKEKNDHRVRSLLAAEIMDRFFELYKSLPFGDHISEYIKRSMIPGKTVSVVRNGNIKIAEAICVCEDLTLLVRYGDGQTEHLDSGEVSIVL